LGNWVRRALRDWRVWALTATIQGPGARAIVRYTPWPALILPITFIAAFLIYGACLHGPLAPWTRRFGSRLGLVVGTICVIAAINVVAYPHADALKHQHRGSDEDNALIDLAGRLVGGQRPLYVATYLGNAPSPGPVWAAVIAPLAVTGTYALLTPLGLAMLVWIVRRAGGGQNGTALALLLPPTSPGFWELSVTGSDLFAIGVLFVALTTVAWNSRRVTVGVSLPLLILVLAAASSRVVFGFVTLCVSLFMWRKNRAGFMLVATATVVVIGVEVWSWWPDSAGVTPLFLIAKLVRQLGAAGIAVALLTAIAGAALALVQLNDRIETWWRSLWLLLTAPLATVSLGVLAALGWDLAAWQAAGYVEVAVPAAVAWVAVTAARPAGSRVPFQTT
jgi:hypothetical protein